MGEPREDPGVGPIAALLGIHRASMGDGRSAFEPTIRPEHMNPHGVVHGGVVYTLVDFAMGGALTSLRLIALATGSFYIQTRDG